MNATKAYDPRGPVEDKIRFLIENTLAAMNDPYCIASGEIVEAIELCAVRDEGVNSCELLGAIEAVLREHFTPKLRERAHPRKAVQS